MILESALAVATGFADVMAKSRMKMNLSSCACDL